ncbi:2-hydroxyacid dehydrogenase [Bacillus suaedae]|uniref:D-glycerate dehydrogenase n=1 Tax=Halalkalibacter suaedae TaxID=2822140 RepID=A0A941APL3_9BACI|nr:D-glycerate dehydrogenase [Bacillus suaedae]
MKPKIYITRKLPASVVCQLEEICEVRMWHEEEKPVPREILEQEIMNVEGILCMLTETIDADLLEKAKKLKVISNMAVGYNNIDIALAKEKGITVTNTPDVLTETTADLTFSLLMASARRIVEASDYLRKGEWQTWSPMQLTGQDIYGSTLGIIGMGRIGESVARRAKGFGMDVLYHNRNRKPESEKKLNLTYVERDTLLKESDFVVLMVPFTDETKHLIGERELSLMKKSSILINTARGGIVDENALYHALVKGDIWAAGLDVFETEPVPLDHPLLTLRNVTTLPHIGSASIQTRVNMGNLAADNLILALQDKKPKYIVV